MRPGLEKYGELKIITDNIIRFHLRRVEAILRDSKEPATTEHDLKDLTKWVANFKISLWFFHPHFMRSMQESDAFQHHVTGLLQGACLVSKKTASVADDCGSLQDLKTCMDNIVRVLLMVSVNVGGLFSDDVSFKNYVFKDIGYAKDMSDIVGSAADLGQLSQQAVQQFMMLFCKFSDKRLTAAEFDRAVAPILKYTSRLSPVDVSQVRFLGKRIERDYDGAEVMLKEGCVEGVIDDNSRDHLPESR